MATAWEVLITNSTIPSGTAWEHLNNQGGAGTGFYLIDGLEVLMDNDCIEAEVDLELLTVEVDSDNIEVEVDLDDIEVEICQTN